MMALPWSRLLEDTFELIELQTANPPGGELAAARWLADRLRPSCARIDIQDLGSDRGNLVAVWDYGPGPALLFNTHLDVVPPESEVQWQPVLQDGQVFGRGACDAKGCLAAMLAACERLAAQPAGLHGKLILAAVADEEVGAQGTLAFLAAGGQATAAIIGEPTDNRAVLSSRGALRAAIHFRGRAAHASTPHLGRNAIYPAARFMLEVEAWNRQLTQAPVPGTCAATVVSGGTKLNIIPDSCIVQVDRRLAPGETIAVAQDQLTAILERLRAEDADLSWEVEPAGIALEPFDLAADHPLACAVLTALGQPAPAPMFPAGTDAPHLIAAGIPALILGPGSLAQAHTAHEHIAVDSLATGAEAYDAVARAILNEAFPVRSCHV